MNTLPAFEKNFYIEHPRVQGRSDQEVAAWRQQHEITVVGENIPKPVVYFDESPFPEYVLDKVSVAYLCV